MKINDDVIAELTQLTLLGDDRQTSLPIIQLKKVKDAEKAINSLKWENFCLEKSGDFTVYLFKNEREIYGQWNNLVAEVKAKLVPSFSQELDNLIEVGKLLESMKDQILFDYIGIANYLTIKKVIPSINFDYFEDIYKLYSAGFIPCGYVRGKYKVL